MNFSKKETKKEMDSIKYYKRYFITPGIVCYEKNNKETEILLLKKKVLDDNVKTIIDKPVIITHEGKEEVGKVVEAYYDVNKGYYVVGFNVWNKKAKDLLDNKGYSVSCNYIVLQEKDANGEFYHDSKYDKEVLNMRFKDLAIVKEPKYQEAKEYVNSSIKGEIMENKNIIEQLENLLSQLKNEEEKKNEKKEDLWSFLQDKGFDEEDMNKVENLIIQLLSSYEDNIVEDEVEEKKNEEDCKEEKVEVEEKKNEEENKEENKDEVIEEKKEEKKDFKLNSSFKKLDNYINNSNILTKEEKIQQNNQFLFGNFKK